MTSVLRSLFALTITGTGLSLLQAQPATREQHDQIQEVLAPLEARLTDLTAAELKIEEEGKVRSRLAELADIKIFVKAADWIIRHDEFYKPDYVKQTLAAIAIGTARAEQFADGKPAWGRSPGRYVLGYYSDVDHSVQPYAVTLPEGFDPASGERMPLHIVLHGRAAQMNEVNFISKFEGKPVPKGTEWIQLDVFGRTNNAYRWSGETDVFEALRDLKRRYRIDEKRITLRGFSMGGAGAWHLGLHHPSDWCSVGPGAGFVDTYEYQKIKEELPSFQHQTLGIYDTVDYALNAANVPVCTYGGELDPQLRASTRMIEEAKQDGVEIKLIVGPMTEHKFHPDSEKEFMAFHLDKSREGRPPFPGLKSIRFETRTLKYNRCDWLTIEELIRQYEPTRVEAAINAERGRVEVKTQNVATLSLARDIAEFAEIDGQFFPLADAADNLLPNVYYTRGRNGWTLINYDDTRKFQDNPDLMKRHGLQGPIDDAFMGSFLCVRGTGTPWSPAQHDWATWTLARFEREFDKWLRGKIRIVDDTELTEEMIEQNHLILFGDPGSNSVMAKVLPDLPIEWTKEKLSADGADYDPDTHGLAMIYPNPLNHHKYVVINSGHTFHEAEFKASNAQLFPRLGDFAIQKFQKSGERYEEETVKALLFNSGWRFPVSTAK